MILFLGLDTQVNAPNPRGCFFSLLPCRSVHPVCLQFVCVESLATSITDLFPRQLRRPCARELLVLAIAVVCFLLGLPLITEVDGNDGGKAFSFSLSKS